MTSRTVEWLEPPVTGAGEEPAVSPVRDQPAAPAAKKPPGTTTTKSITAILGEIPDATGRIAAGVGARVLMDMFKNERSGRLVVDAGDDCKGTLFILHGEPVHAAPIRGDAALLRRLATRGVLKRPPSSPAGEPSSSSLIARLAKNRGAPAVVILEALRDEVRDFARALVAATAGTWSFFLDVDFAEHTPLLPVNPFGLVLEARRRTMPPDALLRLGESLATAVPAPFPGFANVSSRLRAFTGHVDLGGVVDGITSAADIYRLTRLDPLVGGLVLITLEQTGLITMLPAPKSAAALDKRSAPVSVMPLLVSADAQQMSQLSQLPQRGGAEILALYLELKPERDAAAVLGLGSDGIASLATIERAREARMAELDPRAIPAGPSRPYLVARVEELRTKIERAYRTLRTTAAQQLPSDARAIEAYEVGEKIGVGGMAEVFRGHAGDDPSRVVAIKRILPKHRDDAGFARAFLEEARLARRVVHPNVVRIYTVGKCGDDLYLAMELVDGTDLGDLIQRARARGEILPVDVVCRVVADACGGLHAAHTARDRDGNVAPILHCDVSPQNILVGQNGDVKLTDFGIAKAAGADARAASDDDDDDGDEPGIVRGKIAFLAPEIIERGAASVRTDVYAMAMTMYAALGRLPFSRGDVFETMRAALHEPLPPLSHFRDDVPPELDAILLNAAARHPSERPPSAQAMQLEIEDILARRAPPDVGAWLRSLDGEPTVNHVQTATIDISVDDRE